MENVLERLRNRLLSLTEKLTWLPPLLARVAVGLVFAQTGLGKLKNLGQITEFFTDLGIPWPSFNAGLVATTELVGGSLLIVGLASRLVSLPLAFTMVIAILTAKKEELTSVTALFGFSEFLYLIIFVWIAIAGPGRVSIDALLGRRLRRAEPARPASEGLRGVIAH